MNRVFNKPDEGGEDADDAGDGRVEAERGRIDADARRHHAGCEHRAGHQHLQPRHRDKRRDDRRRANGL